MKIAHVGSPVSERCTRVFVHRGNEEKFANDFHWHLKVATFAIPHERTS